MSRYAVLVHRLTRGVGDVGVIVQPDLTPPFPTILSVLTPNQQLTQNEIDAAKLIHFDYLNAQDQQQLVWPTSFVVARAYIDQLARSNGLPAARIADIRDALTRAERASGPARHTALTALVTRLNTDVTTSTDQPKVRLLIAEVTDLNK